MEEVQYTNNKNSRKTEQINAEPPPLQQDHQWQQQDLARFWREMGGAMLPPEGLRISTCGSVERGVGGKRMVE